MSSPEPIAIIGMSCRLPGGANSPEELWRMLRDGRCAWSDVPSDRYNWKAFYSPDPEANGTHNHRGGHFLDQDIAAFDAPFFGITQVEAIAMDPQQRIQLESVYEALENAGISLREIRGSNTSVFMSVSNIDYGQMLMKDPCNAPRYQMTGNGHAILSNRISYVWDLKGPSMTLDTGCSGGLVAVHQACQCLRSGESRMAIAGGVNLILNPDTMIPMSMLGFFSDEGRCFVFDQRASGYGRGEGVATVVLKPLQDAINDNNPIRGMILNTFVNQDGRTRGLTLPNLQAQQQLIRTAYEQVGLDPAETAYVECHGTGTSVGDPIEIEAVGETIGKPRNAQSGRSTLIGSVKSNIGHLESASGLAALVKTVLVLEKGEVPPIVDLQNINPKLQSQESAGWNLKIPLEVEAWPGPGENRRASINSFGYGGTNAHVILQSHHEVKQAAGDCWKAYAPMLQLFVLSAFSEQSLKLAVSRFRQWIDKASKEANSSFLDLAYTLCTRRSLLPWRFTVVASTYNELGDSLHELAHNRKLEPGQPHLIFVFSGQGAQWARMGLQLLHSQPAFRESIARSSIILNVLGADWSLEDELRSDDQESRIHTSAIGQPATTALQIALVDMLCSWNIKPDIVVGHSSGEIAAAYAAGHLNHKAAIMVSYHRGFLSDLARKASGLKGSMLAVGLGETEALKYTEQINGDNGGNICVACVNSPASTTISGDVPGILELRLLLDSQGIWNKVLNVDTAYHSHHMQPVAEEYMHRLKTLRHERTANFHKSSRFFSSVNGKEMSNVDAEYWVTNLLSPVRFSDALQRVYEILLGDSHLARPSPNANDIFPIIEIGPHSSLREPIRQILSKFPNGVQFFPYFCSMRRGDDTGRPILETAGKLLELGCAVNLAEVNQTGKTTELNLKVLSDLPSYVWDHSQTYWHESRLSREYRLRQHNGHALLGTQITVTNSLEPTWRILLNTQIAPWVRGHYILKEVIFPGAGYLIMAMEAMQQQLGDNGTVVRYHFRDVSLSKALHIPNAPDILEVQFSMRPWWNGIAGVTSWQEFRVFSVGSSDTKWIEHCRGLVSASFEARHDEVEEDREECITTASLKERIDGFLALPLRSVDVERMYDSVAARGLEFSGLFRGIVSMDVYGEHTVGCIQPTNPSLQMPSGYQAYAFVHPATFGACFQCSIPTVVDARRVLIPTFMEEIVVEPQNAKAFECEWTAYSTLKNADSPAASMDQVVMVKDNAGNQALAMSVRGLTYAAFSRNVPDDDEGDMAFTLEWKPDIDYMDHESIRALCASPSSPADISAADKRCRLLEQASIYAINRMLELLDTDEIVSQMESHHLKLIQWMRKQKAECFHQGSAPRTSSLSDVEAVIQSAKLSGVEGEMVSVMMKNLVPILRKETSPLTVMLENDLLYRVYREGCFTRCHSFLAKYLELYIFKDPQMMFLELGAGTGGATAPVLDTLTKGGKQRFALYDFTDISAGFFEKAKATFSGYPNIRFRKLNIEEDPVQQGYPEASYDVVIAANVLHATSNIQNTLRNVRKLLKTGGRLLLVEITRCMPYYTLFFGTLPGWWEGANDGRLDGPLLTVDQWEEKLSSSGFSSLEGVVQDFEDPLTTLMVAKALTPSEENHYQQHCIEIVNLIGTASKSELGAAITAEAYELGLSCVQSSFPANKDISLETIYIVLDDEDGALLEIVTHESFESLTSLFTTARRVIWVSRSERNGLGNVKGERALIRGLARCARQENSKLQLITLEIDKGAHRTDRGTAQIITQAIKMAFFSSNDDPETELVEHNGLLQIPRLQAEPAAGKWLQRASGSPSIEIRDFHEDGRYLRLEMEKPGLLDTIQFVDDPISTISLADDEVELQVRAIGINFRDVMVALGELRSEIPMVGDCSGIVTRVGSGCASRFRVGDRVCSLSCVAYSNRPRVKAAQAYRIPADMSFAIAASIPCVFSTAYYCLYEVARLHRAQSILIHSAAGGVGQAAIKLAQLVGATIFATVSNGQKKRRLIDTYGIPATHIFSSKRCTFKQGILRLTQGGGVDVVLNSLSGEFLHESWACTAIFGTFIEIGKTDIYGKNRIDMNNFKGSRSFVSVDLLTLLQHRPEKGNAVMNEVLGMFEREALRSMQSRKHEGKLVLDCSPGVMVKTLATAPPAFKFPQEASYLITGGTGGLGLVICRWMASCGAKNIILLSRRGQQAHGINELSQELLSLGTNLTVLACDVSDIEQVRMVMSRCRTEFPPIKGVIHGAMVLQDRVVERMSLEDFRVPLLPKVAGTRVLIDELASSSLDFIIMLSSSSGIVGNHGQGNYAAGNTFQDALSQYQFPHVRNMICLDFGMIAGAGYVHQHPEINRFYKDHGHHQLPLEKLFSILEYVISPSISGIEIDHRHLIIGSLPDGEKSGYLLRDPKFRHTRKAKLDESHATSQGKGYDLRASLKAATSNQDVYNIIAKEILSKASTLMMVNIQGKDMSKPLTELGLDSLVAVELKTWVSHTFDCTLKASDVLEAKTVVDLAAMVYERSKSPSLTSWKLSAKPETNNMSLENTFTDQIAELPALPLPTLEDTMERYLASARPFAESNSEMQVTSECIRRFLADDGLGQILQSRLLDRQEKSPTANWLHDIHTEALYLEDRRPLTPFTNYFGTYPTRPSSEKYSPAQRAAVISFAVFQFKCMLNAKQIRPETLKGHSVSIDSYHWLFNSCRLPFPLVDRPVKWPSQDHLIAMRNGHLFTVRLNVNGVAVSIAQLTKAFQELIEMADRIAGSNLVSVLTNDRRDAWNENRNILLNASDSNKKTLEFIESADFVICLDKAAPESPEERSHQVWFGSGCNRWNDKPLQL